MNDALVLPAFFVFGIFLGWWFKKLMTWRVLIIAAVLLIAVPIGLIFLAGVVQSDTLGWIGGLSLMFILALGMPVGSGFILGALLAGPSAKKDSPPVARPAKKPLPPLSKDQRGVLMAMGGVAVAFGVIIMLGFALHDPSARSAFNDEKILAVVVAVIIGGTVLGLVWPKIASARRQTREKSDAAAKRQAWLDAASSDPYRKRYAELIKAGDSFWTPERAEYDFDQSVTACCEHLAPIESAMRRAGLKVTLASQGSVSAHCCIDQGALSRQFSLPEGTGYKEVYSRDRSGDDPPHALLFCPVCESRLWVVHTREARPETPIFPSEK